MPGVIFEPSALMNPNSTRPSARRRERIRPIGSGHTLTSALSCHVPVGASAGRNRSSGRTRRPLSSSTPCSTRPSSPIRAMIRSRCESGVSDAVTGLSSLRSSKLLLIDRRRRNRELALSASRARAERAVDGQAVDGSSQTHFRVECSKLVHVRCPGCLERATQRGRFRTAALLIVHHLLHSRVVPAPIARLWLRRRSGLRSPPARSGARRRRAGSGPSARRRTTGPRRRPAA